MEKTQFLYFARILDDPQSDIYAKILSGDKDEYQIGHVLNDTILSERIDKGPTLNDAEDEMTRVKIIDLENHANFFFYGDSEEELSDSVKSLLIEKSADVDNRGENKKFGDDRVCMIVLSLPVDSLDDYIQKGMLRLHDGVYGDDSEKTIRPEAIMGDYLLNHILRKSDKNFTVNRFGLINEVLASIDGCNPKDIEFAQNQSSSSFVNNTKIGIKNLEKASASGFKIYKSNGNAQVRLFGDCANNPEIVEAVKFFNESLSSGIFSVKDTIEMLKDMGLNQLPDSIRDDDYIM